MFYVGYLSPLNWRFLVPWMLLLMGLHFSWSLLFNYASSCTVYMLVPGLLLFFGAFLVSAKGPVLLGCSAN